MMNNTLCSWFWVVFLFVGCSTGATSPTNIATDTTNGRTDRPRVDVRVESDTQASKDTTRTPDTGDLSSSGGDIQNAPVKIEKDIAYVPPTGVQTELATLDLYRRDDGQVRPLALLVHGGSWVGGDKAGFAQKVAPWWVERGYVAAAVNFRLATKAGESPIVKPGDQAHDIAGALAWLLNHAEDYAISTTGVVVLGYSSGAHLVALLGTDESYFQNEGVDETSIAGVISLDVHAYDVPFALQLMVGSVKEQNIPIIEHLFGKTTEEQLASSPINFLDSWAAPALIVSVDTDPNEVGSYGYLVWETGQNYVSALVEAGHQAKHVHDPTETHSSLVGGFGDPGDLVTSEVEAFLESLSP